MSKVKKSSKNLKSEYIDKLIKDTMIKHETRIKSKSRTKRSARTSPTSRCTLIKQVTRNGNTTITHDKEEVKKSPIRVNKEDKKQKAKTNNVDIKEVMSSSAEK